MSSLAWVLATCPRDELRNGKRAVELASKALRLTGDEEVIALDTLATGYAEVGDFPRAIACAEQALARLKGNEEAYGDDYAPRIRTRIKRYEQGLPHRDQGEDGAQ
jgi:hypothetical protein